MNPVRLDANLSCFIFKTNVDDESKAVQLSNTLGETQGVISWNLDREDRENVLRIDFRYIDISALKKQLYSKGIEIQPMPVW